jgi:hypothetical protein
MFYTKFNIHSNFAHLSTTPDDRAPFSCIECDSLKPAILVISVITIPSLLFSTQSYSQANFLRASERPRMLKKLDYPVYVNKINEVV